MNGLRAAAPAPATARASRAGPAGRSSAFVVRAKVQRETDPKKRIVITGEGVCSVFGNDTKGFYDKLLDGTSGISLIERFDASEYPTRFAGQIKNFECAAHDRADGGSLIACLSLGNTVSGSPALARPLFSQLGGLHRQEERPPTRRLPALRPRLWAQGETPSPGGRPRAATGRSGPEMAIVCRLCGEEMPCRPHLTPLESFTSGSRERRPEEG